MPTSLKTDDPPNTAFRLFLDAFGKVNIILGGGISIGVSILIGHFVPVTLLPLWLIALLGLPLLMTLTSCAIALHRAAEIIRKQADTFAHERPTTDIVDAVPPSAPYSHCSILLIVKWSPSATLPVGSNVKITIAEEHHERHLGLGTVRETLSNGSYVVSIDQPYPDAPVAAYIEKLLDKTAKPDLLTRIRIGSTISFQHLSPTMLASFNVPTSPSTSQLASPSAVPQLPASPGKG